MSPFVRFRWVLIAIAAIVTAWSVHAARQIPFDSGVSEFLPENVPEVKSWLDGLRRFDALNAWMVGLEEPGPSMSLDGIRRVQEVTKKLEGMKSSGVLTVRSVTNVASLRESEDGSVNSELLVSAIPSDAASLDALKKRILEDREVLGALVSRDLKGYILVIRADPRKDAAEAARLVEEAVESTRGPLKAHYFGTPFFTAVIFKRLAAQLIWIAPAFVLLLHIVLFFGTRRPRSLILILGASGVALVWWLGVLHVFGRGVSASTGNVALVVFAIASASYAGIVENWQREKSLAQFLVTLLALILGCQAIARMPVAYLAAFGASAGAGLIAIGLVAIFVVAPLMAIVTLTPPDAAKSQPLPVGAQAIFCAITIIAGGWMGSHARFFTTPQTMFSANDEVGETLAFFDDRFGGADFIQVDFHGDLKDPAVAARFLRLTDLLEGSPEFRDVRSVAQILAFLNHGFGDAFRIPSSHAALANIWFFLEGSGDVRNLVTDKHDEAMIMIRVPSHPSKAVSELEGTIKAAIVASTELGHKAAEDRLAAIARSSKIDIPAAKIAATVSAATQPPSDSDRASLDAAVSGRLHTFLESPDSPYRPSDEEWSALAAALAGDAAGAKDRLGTVSSSIEKLATAGMNEKFVDMIVEHEGDIRQSERRKMLASKLWEGQANVPDEFKLRAEGVIADLVDPQTAAGNATVEVTGLPVVAGAIESNLKSGLWTALALILASGALLLFVRPWSAMEGILAALSATGLMLATCRVFGIEIDSGSATLYLLPALLAIAVSAPGRWPKVFMLALGLACASLIFTGALPVTRVAMAVYVGVGSVILVWSFGVRLRTSGSNTP